MDSGGPRAIVVAEVLGTPVDRAPALAPGSHGPHPDGQDPWAQPRTSGERVGAAFERDPPACRHMSEDRWVKGGSKVGENGVRVRIPGGRNDPSFKHYDDIYILKLFVFDHPGQR